MAQLRQKCLESFDLTKDEVIKGGCAVSGHDFTRKGLLCRDRTKKRGRERNESGQRISTIYPTGKDQCVGKGAGGESVMWCRQDSSTMSEGRICMQRRRRIANRDERWMLSPLAYASSKCSRFTVVILVFFDGSPVFTQISFDHRKMCHGQCVSPKVKGSRACLHVRISC